MSAEQDRDYWFDVACRLESERDLARAFHEVECQRTVEAVERMIAAERSESALQAAVARAVAELKAAQNTGAPQYLIDRALEALR